MLYSPVQSTKENDQALAAVLEKAEQASALIKAGTVDDEQITKVLSTKLDAKILEEIKKIVKDAAVETEGNKAASYLKIILALSSSLGAAYFGGPFTATAARKIYEKLYENLFGTPSAYHPSYWLVYLPGREHVSKLAYEWGPYLMGMVAGPTVYVATHTPQAVANFVKNRLASYQADKQSKHALMEMTPLDELMDEFFIIKQDEISPNSQQIEEKARTELPDWEVMRREPLTFAANNLNAQLRKSTSSAEVASAVLPNATHSRSMSF